MVFALAAFGTAAVVQSVNAKNNVKEENVIKLNEGMNAKLAFPGGAGGGGIISIEDPENNTYGPIYHTFHDYEGNNYLEWAPVLTVGDNLIDPAGNKRDLVYFIYGEMNNKWDKDYYKFDVIDGCRIKITVTYNLGNAKTEFWGFNEQGNANYYTTSRDVTVDNAGRYAVGIYGCASSYTLVLRVTY